jgi:hypothetical protein
MKKCSNKKCSRYGEELDESEFYKDKLRKDGLSHRCKQCHIELVRNSQLKDIEALKKRTRAYYLANRDKLIAYSKEYAKSKRDDGSN